MKAVLIAVVGLLAIGAHAQTSCPSPVYTQDIVPVCLADKRVKLPYYADPTSYYSCSTGKPVITKCAVIFTYVYQECTTCAQYIPAPECSALKLNLTCVAISGSTTVSNPADATTTEKTTTVKTTTVKTTTSPGTTTAGVPTPPEESTLAPGESTLTPGDTTISVPGPPGPNNPDVPQPPTPSPTVGTFPTGPPSV